MESMYVHNVSISVGVKLGYSRIKLYTYRYIKLFISLNHFNYASHYVSLFVGHVADSKGVRNSSEAIRGKNL